MRNPVFLYPGQLTHSRKMYFPYFSKVMRDISMYIGILPKIADFNYFYRSKLYTIYERRIGIYPFRLK